MLSGLAPMRQPSQFECLFLDPLPSLDDGCGPPEIDIGGRQVAKALVVSAIVVVLDKGPDLGFEVAGQVIILQQDAVFQRLMPSFDLSLDLGMVRGAPNVIHALGLKPSGKLARDLGSTVIREQAGLVGTVAPRHP
jgi:hypothetical protein